MTCRRAFPHDQIVEDIPTRYAMLGVIRLRRVFQKNAWLQLWPVFLANPGEFELVLHSYRSVILLSTVVECGLRSLQNIDHV